MTVQVFIRAVVVLVAALAVNGPAQAQKSVSLLNVSYDPTRELYQEFNAAFESTRLPEHPDYERASAFMISARRRALSESFRIIYGPNYTANKNLSRLRSRGLGHKPSLNRTSPVRHSALSPAATVWVRP